MGTGMGRRLGGNAECGDHFIIDGDERRDIVCRDAIR